MQIYPTKFFIFVCKSFIRGGNGLRERGCVRKIDTPSKKIIIYQNDNNLLPLLNIFKSETYRIYIILQEIIRRH